MSLGRKLYSVGPSGMPGPFLGSMGGWGWTLSCHKGTSGACSGIRCLEHLEPLGQHLVLP